MNSTIRQCCAAVLASAAIAALAGCYTFAPVRGVPPVGNEVRATVTDEEALRLSRQTGQLARTLDGRLVGATEDSVVVSVVTFRVASEVSGSRQLRQSVVIPRAALERLETRELSTWRTGIAGLLAATAVYVGIERVVVGGRNGEDTDDDEPIGTLIPIFRIPIGR